MDRMFFRFSGARLLAPVGAVLLVPVLDGHAMAQDRPSNSGASTNVATSATSGGKPGAEYVTVQGQAASGTGSLGQALRLKKDADNLIEVQPQSEIRKLPDVNVAEALQRVSGISLVRYR